MLTAFLLRLIEVRGWNLLSHIMINLQFFAIANFSVWFKYLLVRLTYFLIELKHTEKWLPLFGRFLLKINEFEFEFFKGIVFTSNWTASMILRLNFESFIATHDLIRMFAVCLIIRVSSAFRVRRRKRIKDIFLHICWGFYWFILYFILNFISMFAVFSCNLKSCATQYAH